MADGQRYYLSDKNMLRDQLENLLNPRIQDKEEEEKVMEDDDEEYGSYSGKLQFIPGNLVLPGELKVEDLHKIELMGEGSGGYVEKLMHKPSGVLIAMKVLIIYYIH